MIDAMAKYGVPHKMRADCGKENVDVERVAMLLREAGYKIVYMKGRSVHNQRIEVSAAAEDYLNSIGVDANTLSLPVTLTLLQRYWGDLCPYITPIASALQGLEHEGTLDMRDSVHHTALHLVLLPYVNTVCRIALDAWNNHYISTKDVQTTPLKKCASCNEDVSCRLASLLTVRASLPSPH